MNLIRSFITDRIIILSVLFLVSITSYSQKHYFDNYSVKEGLAQSNVYAIAQDKGGYLWLGTASGVSKFNGKEFVNYTTEEGLAEGAVRAIHIDSAGTIWLGHSDGGVSRYIDGKIETILSMSADITSFVEDNKGFLWVGSFGQGAIKISNPYVTNKDSINFTQYKGQEGLSDIVFQITILKNGNIYFVTDVGVKYLHPQKKEFQFYRVKNMPTYFQITRMYEDLKGDQWFGSYNGGLYQYRKEDHQLKIYDVRDGLAHNWISTIAGDSKGNIWVGTWGGGVTQISSKGLLTLDQKKGLIDTHIRYITEDREGNILFGTKENGLIIYKGSQFVSYGIDDGLIDEHVWSILTDKEEKIWLGTNQGISVLKNNQIVRNYTQDKGLPYEEVRFIKQDKNNNIWIGTWGGGVMEYNSRTDNFEMNYRINSYMTQDLITALEVDKTNNLWVGTTDGLIYYEINTQLIDRLTQSHGLAGNEITALYADSKNVLWVGARSKGLTRIKDTTISIIDLTQKITPTCIIEDEKGRLWIGTEGKGVLLFDGQKIVRKYTVDDGLLSDYITLLNIDDEGNIWVGTNKGLNKFDAKASKFYSYTEKMGVVGIESKKNATFKDNKGDLWFGTVKGVVKLNAAEVSENTLEPLTQITNFRVNLEEREMLSGLELDYKEKSIIFDYNSICLSNPDEVQYQVMLEGIDEEWNPPTNQTYASYSPLPPGEYVFKVRAQNNNGVWNKQPVTYAFKITAPFWQTIPFWIGCITVLFLAFIVFVKFRERSLINEKKKLEGKVRERTEEVVQKSTELEIINKDIIDSITYAKRIQDAILPTGHMFSEQLSQTFVLFQPKDIVSGDFYWITFKEEKSLFAAIDCTGHGVPGAFMSIVGHSLLDKIVGENGITKPSEILDQLNKGVSDSLRQESEEGTVKDGMDLALCTFDKKSGILEFSGAYNPLYIVTEHQLEVIEGEQIEPDMTNDDGLMLYEIKANRFPIGSYDIKEIKTFTNHSFKLKKGDTVYLFSDGYSDQFGGPKGKKFRYKQFKQLFLAVNGLDIDEQKTRLEETMKDWMGELEQIDDIIVIGSRL